MELEQQHCRSQKHVIIEGLRACRPCRLADDFRLLLGAQPAVDKTADQGADDRRYPKQPELGKRPTTDEHIDFAIDRVTTVVRALRATRVKV